MITINHFLLHLCLFHVLICIMHSAFNLMVFPNSMFTLLLFFFILKGLCALVPEDDSQQR